MASFTAPINTFNPDICLMLTTLNLLADIRDKYLQLGIQKKHIIGTFPDFVTFYTIGVIYEDLFSGSDNDNSFIAGGVQIHKFGKYVVGSVSYRSMVIPLFRIEPIVVGNNPHTRVAIYGKGLHIMRLDSSIVQGFYEAMDILLFSIKNETKITLSRLDVTTDCSRLNFIIKCNLITKYAPIFRNNITGKMETKYYGRKKDPVMVRMYDKKTELIDKGYSHLYPEYHQYDELMRYEIVLRGRGIPNDIKNHFSNLSALRPLLDGSYSDNSSINSLSLARSYHKKGVRTDKKLFVDFNAYLRNISEKYDTKIVGPMLDNIYKDFIHSRS